MSSTNNGPSTGSSLREQWEMVPDDPVVPPAPEAVQARARQYVHTQQYVLPEVEVGYTVQERAQLFAQMQA